RSAGLGGLPRLAAQRAAPMVGAAARGVLPVTGQNVVSRYLAARAPVDLGPREARVAPLTRLSYVPTAALLVRCSAIAGRGFDPGLRYGEDVDLIWRMIAAGWRGGGRPPPGGGARRAGSLGGGGGGGGPYRGSGGAPGRPP